MISVKKHARALNINSERDSKTSHQTALHNHVTFCREILSALDIGSRLPDRSQMAIRSNPSVRVHAA